MPIKDLLEHHIDQDAESFREIRASLDMLNRFMWVLIGISIGFSHVGSKLFEIAVAMAGGK